MLPGINEDIVRGARVYHLQTEDRGERNPEGTSVLFLEGAVLASERRSYMGVTADGDRVRLVKKLMIRQHRSVLRRILEGEFDDVQVARRDFGESETEAEPLILEAGTLPEMGAMAAASAPGEARIPATPPPFDPERLRAATAAIAGVPIAPAQAAPATVLLVDLPPGGAAAAASSDVTLDGFGATVDIPGDLVDAAARPAPPPSADDDDEEWPPSGFCAEVVTHRPFDVIVALHLDALASNGGAGGAGARGASR